MDTTALRRPFLNEYTTEQWDAWRSYIHKGGTASWPRDAFEALLDGIDEERREAADAIERLEAERADMLAALRMGLLADEAGMAVAVNPYPTNRAIAKAKYKAFRRAARAAIAKAEGRE